jgi:hypothetical protein
MYESLRNNSEDKSIKLIVHINECLQTKEFCEKEKIQYTFSETNQGIFWPLNSLTNLIETPYVLFLADDFVLLPKWDYYLLKVLSYYKQYNEDNIWIAPRLIEPVNCFAPQEHPYCTIKDFGRNLEEFNNKYSEEELENLRSKDNQLRKLPNGNMIISVKAFNQLEKYDLNYKAGSDSDLTWRFVKKYGTDGIKQVSKSLIYHFGSIVTNKNKEKREEFERQGRELFQKNHGFWIGDITKRILENNI